MLYVVTGGSGSGKSEYAERLAVDRRRSEFPEGRLLYIATMRPGGEECGERIARHRRLRRGKGFSTVECCDGLGKIKAGKQDVLLVECMSNLLANRMYPPGGETKRGAREFQEAEEILAEVLELERKAGCVIAVTNEIFSESGDYGEEAKRYIRQLGRINRGLAKAARAVAEVVCSIPLAGKGELPC